MDRSQGPVASLPPGCHRRVIAREFRFRHAAMLPDGRRSHTMPDRLLEPGMRGVLRRPNDE